MATSILSEMRSNNVKRFVVMAYDHFYPSGGSCDIPVMHEDGECEKKIHDGMFDTEEELEAALPDIIAKFDFVEVIDTQEQKWYYAN